MAMSKKDAIWQRSDLSQTFLEGVRGAIPLASEQLEVMWRIIAAARPQLSYFLDLGCGDGILSQAILTRFPDAKGILLDFSAPMLEAARQRLSPFRDRLEFVRADFGEPQWVETVGRGGAFEAIVSGFAIHHQSDDRKREIYAEIYRLLAPGGIFLNLEHVSSPSEWVGKIHDELFVDSLYRFHQQRGTTQSRDEIAREYYYRPDKAANILAPVETQCEWLRHLGFTHVDCYVKFFELALFGGIREVL
jgi:ubiquinone/menaquinone biosynthesis C-methylase UbiE